MTKLAGAATLAVLFLLSACTAAHARRVSARQLNKLAGSQEKFVLVFGSVKTLEGGRDITRRGAKAGAAIRFIYNDPSSVLQDVPISSGDRFYALLRPPAAATYLDQFDAEVRWVDPVYDKVTHTRLKDDPAFAMYIGEIELNVLDPAGDAIRTSRKQLFTVTVRDDFETANREIKGLYPKFHGEVIRSPQMRTRPGPPPTRIQP